MRARSPPRRSRARPLPTPLPRLAQLGTHSLGPERGKAIVDVSALDRAKGKPDGPGLGRRTRVAASDLSIEDLRPIVAGADAMRVRVQGMLAQPWIEAALLPSRKYGESGDPADFTKSMDDPRWAAFLGATPRSDYAQLPVSAVLKGASGRYRLGAGAKSARAKLRLVPARGFDAFVASGADQDTLLVVCCLASWLPQANRAEQWLEALNGELAAERAAAPGVSPPFSLAKFDMSASRLLRERYNINTMPMYLMYFRGRLAYASNVLNGFGSAKEDMRAQVRRARCLPVSLLARPLTPLVTLRAPPDPLVTLRARPCPPACPPLDPINCALRQAAKTTALAQSGQFLPDDFRFGKTDNALMDDMVATLKGL